MDSRTSDVPNTRFFSLINHSARTGVPATPATYRALVQAERLILQCFKSKPSMVPTDLLNLRGLLKLLSYSGIKGWLPVQRMPLQGYVSWLGIWENNEMAGPRLLRLISEYVPWLGIWKNKESLPLIALDQSAYVRIIRGALGSRRSQSVLLSIVGHEIGHEVMRDPSVPRQFVTDMGHWLAADPAGCLDEAEAWLFAAFLQGFVLADIGSAMRPDETTSYM